MKGLIRLSYQIFEDVDGCWDVVEFCRSCFLAIDIPYLHEIETQLNVRSWREGLMDIL